MMPKRGIGPLGKEVFLPGSICRMRLRKGLTGVAGTAGQKRLAPDRSPSTKESRRA